MGVGGEHKNEQPRLFMQRTFRVDPQTLFRALTEPRAMIQWFGPDNFTVRNVELDLAERGRWLIELCTPDGTDIAVGGEYREINAPHRLVMTWAWASTPQQVSLVTLELVADGPSTVLHLTQERLQDAASRDSHAVGWGQSLTHLQDYLQTVEEART